MLDTAIRSQSIVESDKDYQIQYEEPDKVLWPRDIECSYLCLRYDIVVDSIGNEMNPVDIIEGIIKDLLILRIKDLIGLIAHSL